MHSKSLAPAGKAVELVEMEDGQYIKSHIVEPGAVKLVDAQVYQAYSVGLTNVKLIRDADAPGGRIVGGDFIETSLVDYPSNQTCKFSIVKRANGVEEWTEAEDTVDLTKLPESVMAKIAEAALVKDETVVVPPDGTVSEPIEGDGAGAALEPIVADPETEEKSAAPLVLKRLHDSFCPCYGLDKVAEAHPVLAKNGAMLELGPQAREAVWAMLNQEVSEDAGTGKNAWDIECLSDLYCSVTSWVQSEMFEAAYDVVAAARTQLHKQFSEAYPDAELSPVPPPEAGSFSREYLRGGHAVAGESGDARMPETMAVTPVRFTGKAEEAAAWLLGLHDQVAKLYPELCPLEKSEAPAPEAPPAEPTEPTEPVVPQTLAEQVADSATSTPQPLVLAAGDGTVTPVTPEMLKAAVEEVVAPREEALKAEIAKLTKQLDEFAREPDPDKAPFRGTAVVSRTPDIERPSALKAAQERDESEYDGYLVRQAEHHPIPEIRQRAQELLRERAEHRVALTA